MPKARTVVKKKAARLDYTRSDTGCLVYTIEFVTEHPGTEDEHEALQQAMDALRSYASAEIVKIESVQEKWDAACAILRKRAVQ